MTASAVDLDRLEEIVNTKKVDLHVYAKAVLALKTLALEHKIATKGKSLDQTIKAVRIAIEARQKRAP